MISSSSGNGKNKLSLAGWSCLRKIVNYTSSWFPFVISFVSLRNIFSFYQLRSRHLQRVPIMRQDVR